MSKRPIRCTLSLTPEEYDRLCWLAFYWGENPSTLAATLMTEHMAAKINASSELQKQYSLYQKSKMQAVPGKKKEREQANGQTEHPHRPANGD